MTPGMASNIMTESVAESVAPVAPAAPVALAKKGKVDMLDLGHVLRGLKLCMLERDGAVYIKASWVIVFFYECHTDCIKHIMKDLRDTKELSQEIVTLKVGKQEGEWFTLAEAKMVLGMVPYRITRKERAELAEEFKKLGKAKPAGEGKAGEARAAPEVVKLKDGQESVIKMRQEEGADEDGDGWLDVLIVWLGGKEYVSTRDVVKHTIEKTGIQVVRAWTRVKAGIHAGMLETHKFKGSGEVVQDVMERLAADQLVLALTGEMAEKNRGRMLAALAGDHVDQGTKPAVACKMTEEELLDALDSTYPTWLERITGQPGAKRARRA
jgi:hypothetical protein